VIANTLSACGNGILEVGEMCDLGKNNGSPKIIDQGRFKGKSCTSNCNITDIACNVLTAKLIPECTHILSPNIME